MNSGNTELLWAFCTAARHEKHCLTWEEHRGRLNAEAGFIERLIASIPDAVAVGKTSQRAAKIGQDVLLGETPVEPPKVVNERDPELPPKVLHWSKTSYGKDNWHPTPLSNPIHVAFSVHREDARRISIQEYKPRQVLIYFDGEPDEWNGKR